MLKSYIFGDPAKVGVKLVTQVEVVVTVLIQCSCY